MPGDVRLIRSPISVAGMVLTTVSAVLFLVMFLADVLGLHTNPYIGIVFFLVLPGVFVIGLRLSLISSIDRLLKATMRGVKLRTRRKRERHASCQQNHC